MEGSLRGKRLPPPLCVTACPYSYTKKGLDSMWLDPCDPSQL